MLTSRLIDARSAGFPTAGATRRRSSRWSSRPTPTTIRTCQITGASAALALSSIPQARKLDGVRVGYVDGAFVINPTFDQRKRSTLDLIVAGSKDGIVMVEAGAKEVPEAQMVQALERAHAAIKEIVAGIDALAAQAGKPRVPALTKEISRSSSGNRGSGPRPLTGRCGSRTSSRTTRRWTGS